MSGAVEKSWRCCCSLRSLVCSQPYLIAGVAYLRQFVKFYNRMRHYPFLNPHISAQATSQQTPAYVDKTTAQQQFNKIVQEVMLKKNREKLNNPNSETIDRPKCSMHPARPSKVCRQCKALLQSDKPNAYIVEQQPQPPLTSHNLPTAPIQQHFMFNSDTPLSHINEKLKKNVQSSQYFRGLYSLKSFPEVLSEIENECRTVQTFQKGSAEIPTKFMCLLYKFILMRLTAKQVRTLIESKNAYVKAMGFLYSRLLCSYEQVFDWLGPHLFDQELFYPTIDQTEEITMGQYVERLMLELSHYQLRLPRIPTKLDKEYQHKITQLKEQKREEKIKEQKAIEKDMEKEKEKEQVKINQGAKKQLGIVAIIMINGRKQRLKVSELASDKVIAYNTKGQLQAFQYDEVQLQDAKIQSKQAEKKKIESKRSRSRSSRSSRSRSYSKSRSRSHKRRRRSDKKHKKNNKNRRQKHRKRYSSSSSSRSSSRDKRKRRKSPSSSSSSSESVTPQKPKTNDIQKPKPVIPQIIPSKAGLIDTKPKSSLELLKASIKNIATVHQASNPAPPETQPGMDIESIRKKYEVQVQKQTWKDPVLQDDEQEEVLRLG